MSGSKLFPGFDELFRMKVGRSDRAFRAKIAMDGREDVTFMRGEGPFNKEFSARWAMGGKMPSDFVGTTLAIPVMINQRVRDLLASEGFTGWVTRPCRVEGRAGDSHDYHLLGITGRCGSMQYERSEVFRKILPGGPTNYLRGMYFDPDTWDGSDFFLAGETVIKVVTERVRRALLKHKVRNITLERLSEVEFGAIDVGVELPPPTLH